MSWGRVRVRRRLRRRATHRSLGRGRRRMGALQFAGGGDGGGVGKNSLFICLFIYFRPLLIDQMRQ